MTECRTFAFPLEVVDGWPPLASEALPFEIVDGGYRAMVAPLFIKDLSVGDVLRIEADPTSAEVKSWVHLSRSGNSTIWILRVCGSDQPHEALARVRELGCNTVTLGDLGIYAIDVPTEVPIALVDVELKKLSQDAFAVAFPSFRHDED